LAGTPLRELALRCPSWIWEKKKMARKEKKSKKREKVGKIKNEKDLGVPQSKAEKI